MEIIVSTTLILLIMSLIANVCYHSALKKASKLYNKLKKEYIVLQSTLDEVNKDYIILQDHTCNLDANKIIAEYELELAKSFEELYTSMKDYLNKHRM